MDLLDVLNEQGSALLDTARIAGLEAPVPSCPEWMVRDLVRHIGGVHHWAHAQLTGSRDSEIEGDLEDIVGGWPPDDELFDWAAARHSALVAVLRDGDPDYPYWTWRAPITTALDFWTRRQAHETAIHRVDADLAAGVRAEFAADLAADGVDELIVDIIGHRKGPAPLTVSLALVADDHPGRWWVDASDEGYRSGEGPHDAELTVTGPVSDLYRLVWHRLLDRSVRLEGDATALDRFYEMVNIRWT